MATTFAFASSVPSAPSIFREKDKSLREEYAKVTEELSLMEQQYKLNAQRKKLASERKVKKGLETKHTFYTNEISSMRNKAETDSSTSKLRIAKWEEKVEAIDKALALKIRGFEEAIEKAKQQAALEKREYATKLEIEAKKLEAIDKRLEDRLTNYYRPIMDALLEPEVVEEEVKMPPSYDKLVARKLNLEGSLASNQRIMKLTEEAEASPEPAKVSLSQEQEKLRREAAEALDRKFAADEEALKRMRDQARREVAEAARLKKQQEEAERQEKLEELERERAAKAAQDEVAPVEDSVSVASEDSDLTYPPPRHRMFQKEEQQSLFPPVLGNTKRVIKIKKTK